MTPWRMSMRIRTTSTISISTDRWIRPVNHIPTGIGMRRLSMPISTRRTNIIDIGTRCNFAGFSGHFRA
jgi:hypothetical protein